MFRIFRHYIPKILILLGTTESLILFLSVFLSTGGGISPDHALMFPRAALFCAVMMFVMMAMGLYHNFDEDNSRMVLTRISLSFLLGVVMLVLLYNMLPGLSINHDKFLFAVLISFSGIVTCRLARHFWHNRIPKSNILVIGTGKKAQQLESLNHNYKNSDVRIRSYLDIEENGTRHIAEDRIIDIKQDLSNLAQIAFDNDIREIVIALDERRNTIPINAILDCKMRGIAVTDVNSFLERQLGKICINTLDPSTLIYCDGFIQGEIKSLVKRSFDITVSLALLVLMSPVMLLTMLAILVESSFRGSVIYSQKRIGANDRPFRIYKFRSMRENAEVEGNPVWASKDDARVTRVGRFIRKTRIDELPQLFNVLKGDMSFVGPRPERPEFTRELSGEIPFYSLRHHVKPGITGWAQICFPYGASKGDAREKLQYDLYYLKNNTLFLDILILIQTAAVIFLGNKGAR